MTAGTLDRTFGLLGMSGADFGGADAAANAVVVQTDGKILAAGYSRLGGPSALAIARFYPNGFLDPAFGGGPGLSPGELRIPLARGTSEVLTMALQSDGKIVLAGDVATSAAGDTIMVVARLLPDGRLDPGFGVGGVVLLESLRYSRAHAVFIAHDGRIILAGPSVHDRLLFITLVALRSDGSLDPAFGTGGVVLTAPGIPSSLFGPVAFGAVDQGLGFVAVGRSIFAAGTPETLQPVALRYKGDGSLDGTFADRGVFTVSGLAAQYLAVAVSANKNILAAGNLSATPPQFLFSVLEARTGHPMLPHGPVITTSFADLGYPIALCQACAVHYDRQTERWLLAGLVEQGATRKIALARYQFDGSLDATFAGGRVVTTFLTGNAEAAALAIQPADRKIVIAGNADYSGAKMFALARYLGI